MKTLEIAEATAPLAHYVAEVTKEPLILTTDGRPVAALVPIKNTDLETASLNTSPQFLELIERSRARQTAQGGLSAEEVRRRLRSPSEPRT